ncbi:hypothetical protein Taro_043436 [Colocasia esculenta]|uniref:Pentatricopeptide repeat-containing protein n=1 Tax=Colocasia esculenta TaxID=4460 RepID=A0A843X1I7_COLES|nr:hypothetical protein [Colocasia esculenta]
MQVARSLASAGRCPLHLLLCFRSFHLNGHDQDHELLLLRCLSHCDLRGARQLLDGSSSRGDPDADVVRWTSLLSRYARRGHVDEARALFDVMSHRNLVTWNAMLSAYAASGRLDAARHLFEGMPERNVVSWTSMLCALLRAGRTHEAAELFGAMPDRNVVSWNAMVAGLARNGELDAARRMFDGMPERDRASWNAMIAAYTERSMMGEARRLFDEMGGDTDVVTWTTVISGYCRAGDVGEAYGLFLEMPPVTRNVVTWTAMIGGLSSNGYYEDAITLFLEMNQTARVAPNCETLISLLYACTGLRFPCLGKQIHAQIILCGMNGPDLRDRLAKGLIQMYCRFHVLDWAQWIFIQSSVNCHDTVVWNSMVNGFAQIGRLDEARWFFDRTPFPDQITGSTMVSAYFNAGEPWMWSAGSVVPS